MIEARRKIQHFEIEIRRSLREKIISKKRKDCIDANNISRDFEDFVVERQVEVSRCVAEGVSLMQQEMVEQFMSILEGSAIVFDSRLKGQPNVWYFDCLSKNNLKFMGELCKHQEDNSRTFYKKFTDATIKAHEEYKTISYTYQLMVKDSQCLILPQHLKLQGLNEGNPLLEILNKSYDEEKFLSVLDYWATYLNFESVFNPNQIIIMVKTFLFWFQHTEIHQKEPTYDFIFQIISILKQSGLLTNKNQPSKELFEVMTIFVEKIKSYLPFAFATYNFLQLGEILLRIIEAKIQGLLSALLFRSETIERYIKMIFSLSVEPENIPMIKMGMLIVNSIASTNCLLRFQDNKYQRVDIFKRIAIEYILYNELQAISIAVLREFMNSDHEKDIQEVCQALEYGNLMGSLNIFNQENALYLLVYSLRAARQNKKVYDKILKDAELMKRMSAYCLEYEEYEQLVQQLALVIDSNITFFVDNYMNNVNAMREIAMKTSFEGQQVFLEETEKYIDLKIKEDSL